MALANVAENSEGGTTLYIILLSSTLLCPTKYCAHNYQRVHLFTFHMSHLSYVYNSDSSSGSDELLYFCIYIVFKLELFKLSKTRMCWL